MTMSTSIEQMANSSVLSDEQYIQDEQRLLMNNGKVDILKGLLKHVNKIHICLKNKDFTVATIVKHFH